ncbi:ESPR-type extended signal peptide-containing protein [Sutterella sp.]|uniref:ESPR-type extended signal peptide-containing protein n=1 Tax=Sutterella sp. TaxID=1981025 RepID=UPI0026E0EB4E|nr:ESPR-type extended signal peptide-containing protein [Sutterella sp.]MDO5532237.1 ESPR-type extended signal peptide-containing protein [Sutterella sp.]
MNKTYKVIWSKARRALMVVNEATSSIQAKGTKTVLAAAVAAVLAAGAGDAFAINYANETDIKSGVYDISGDHTLDSGITIQGTSDSAVFPELHDSGSILLTAPGFNLYDYGEVLFDGGSTMTVSGNMNVSGSNVYLGLNNTSKIVVSETLKVSQTASDYSARRSAYSGGISVMGGSSITVGNLQTEAGSYISVGSNSNITATGSTANTVAGEVTLLSNGYISATDSTISLQGTLNMNGTSAVYSEVVLASNGKLNVAGTNTITSLDTTGASNGSVNVTGTLTISESASLATGTVSLASTGKLVLNLDGLLSGSTLASGAVTGSGTLTVDGLSTYLAGLESIDMDDYATLLSLSSVAADGVTFSQSEALATALEDLEVTIGDTGDFSTWASISSDKRPEASASTLTGISGTVDADDAGTWGAARLADGTTALTLGENASLTLKDSTKNNGNFISESDGTTPGDAVLSSGSTLTLEGSGVVGDIASATGATGTSLVIADGGEDPATVTTGSLGTSARTAISSIEVTGNTNVTTSGNLYAGDYTLTDATHDVSGTANVSNDATIKNGDFSANIAVVGGDLSVTDDSTFDTTSDLGVTGNITVDDSTLTAGGNLSGDKLTMTDGAEVNAGKYTTLGSVDSTDSSFTSTGARVTVTETVSLDGSHWIAKESRLGELELSSGSTFGYEYDEESDDYVQASTPGSLFTYQNEIKDDDGNVTGTTTGDVTVGGEEDETGSKLYATSASIAGSLTVQTGSEFETKGGTTVDGDITVSGSSLTTGGTLAGGDTKVTSGSVTVTDGYTNLDSLTLNDSDFTSSGDRVTVTGTASLESGSHYLAASSSELGELIVSGGSTVGYEADEEGNYTIKSETAGSITTNQNTITDADGNTSTTSGDVIVGDPEDTTGSQVYGASANIAGSLTVQNGSEFETKGGTTVAGDITVSGSSVTTGGTLAGGDTKVTSGTVTVTDGYTNLDSLALNDSDFTSEGDRVTVTGTASLESGSHYLAASSSELGELLVSGGSTVGYELDENGSWVKSDTAGAITTKQNTITNEDGSTSTTSGDVIVGKSGDSSGKVHTSSANIAGDLEVLNGSEFSSDEDVVAGDITVSNSDLVVGRNLDGFDMSVTSGSSVEVGTGTTSLSSLTVDDSVFVSSGSGTVTVEGATTLTTGAEYYAAGTTKTVGLTVSGGSLFGIDASGNGTGGTLISSGKVLVTGTGTDGDTGGTQASTLYANNASITGDLEVSDGAKYETAEGTDVTGSITVSDASAEIGGVFSGGATTLTNATLSVAGDNAYLASVSATSASTFGASGNVAVSGAVTLDGESSWFADGSTTLGELVVKGDSTFGCELDENGDYVTTEGAGSIITKQNTITDADGNASVTSGDVIIGESGESAGYVHTATASIAGSLTVQTGSELVSEEDIAVSGSITVSGSEVTAARHLAGGATQVTSGSVTVTDGYTTLDSLTLSDGDFASLSTKTVTIDGETALTDAASYYAAGTSKLGDLVVEGGSSFGYSQDESSAATGGALITTGSVTVSGSGTNDAGETVASKLFASAATISGADGLTVADGAQYETAGKTDVLEGLTTVTGSGSVMKAGGTSTLAGLTVSGGTSSSGEETTATGAAAYFESLTLTDAATVSENALLYVGDLSATTLPTVASLQTGTLADSLSVSDNANADNASAYSSVLYLNTSFTAPDAGVSVSSDGSAAAAANEIAVGTGGALVLGASAFTTVAEDGTVTAVTDEATGKKVYTADITGDVSVASGGVVDLSSLSITSASAVKLTSGTISYEDVTSILTGSILWAAQAAEGSTDTITFGLSSTGSQILTGNLSASLAGAITAQAEGDGFDETTSPFIMGILESAAAGVTSGDPAAIAAASRTAGQAIESAARLASQSGVFQSSVMAMNMITGFTESRLGFSTAAGSPAAVRLTGSSQAFSLAGAFADAASHTTMTDSQAPAAADTGSAFSGSETVAWVTPVWSRTKSDGFDAAAFSTGIDAKMHGVALGVDWAAGDSARFGVAAQIGEGDTDSTGELAKTATDYDFYGVTVYGGREAGQWTFVGDLSFGWIDGETTQTNYGGTVKADTSSKIFSAGAKARYTFETECLDIAPYAGLRFNFVHMDAFDATTNGYKLLGSDSSTKTWAEVPVGVQFSKALKASDGTVVKPVLDLSVIPVIGDTNLETTVKFTGISNAATTSTEVIDRVNWSAKLGVTAEKGMVGLGLGVSYTGSSNADNYAVTGNLRWKF